MQNQGWIYVRVMLYNIESDFKSVQRRIEYLEEDNTELILTFLDRLFAEGMSKTRIVKYANHLKVISEKMGKSFLDVDDGDITAFLSWLEQSDYAPHTKRDYKTVLKRLFYNLGKEELVENVKQTLKRNKRKLPGDILTKDEIIKMIEAADHPRNKAMIAILYEGYISMISSGSLLKLSFMIFLTVFAAPSFLLSSIISSFLISSGRLPKLYATALATFSAVSSFSAGLKFPARQRILQALEGTVHNGFLFFS